MAALPHPDGGRLADRAAAGQQRRPHRDRGAGRRPRRDQLAAHQRPGRGARPAGRGRRRDRAAHPAGHHGRDRRDQRRRPARRLLVRGGADRPAGGRGGGRSSPGSAQMSPDGSMTGGILARHRERLVHRRDRRGLVRLPAEAGEGREEDRRRELPHRHGRASRWRSCGSAPRSSGSRSRRWPAAAPSRDQPAVDAALSALVAAARYRREPGPADAGRGPRRGHPRRDLRRPARRWGAYTEPPAF